MYQKTSVKIAFMALTALVAWFAIVLQFSISFSVYVTEGRTFGGILVQLLSYFTILSNILVAKSLTLPLLNPTGRWGKYFSSASATGAITVYIATVGITYNIILRNLIVLEGFSILANELLHVVVPVLYVIYWFLFAAKARLKWSEIYYWLIYPLVYLVYILIRGAISGYYPYPFVDVGKLGYASVAMNSLGMIIGFAILSVLLILAGRAMYKSNN
ncbi:Pr6Pr family membrane protein [Mucilaginibacter mallensis]|nr:Pr6Pr family membrane protein [Mucilaginibacter mallensis]